MLPAQEPHPLSHPARPAVALAGPGALTTHGRVPGEPALRRAGPRGTGPTWAGGSAEHESTFPVHFLPFLNQKSQPTRKRRGKNIETQSRTSERVMGRQMWVTAHGQRPSWAHSPPPGRLCPGAPRPPNPTPPSSGQRPQFKARIKTPTRTHFFRLGPARGSPPLSEDSLSCPHYPPLSWVDLILQLRPLPLPYNH